VYDALKKKLCPQLSAQNSLKTSDPTLDYNCLAWAIGRTDVWMDIPNYFQPFLNLEPSTLDHSAKGYASLLETEFGFVECDSSNMEDGHQKVALYEKDGDWTHIAVQLAGGKWSSKLGGLEDITHDSVDVLAGGQYGHAVIFMKRPSN